MCSHAYYIDEFPRLLCRSDLELIWPWPSSVCFSKHFVILEFLFAYNWVADFLLDRKHFTKFERALSSNSTFCLNVWQGGFHPTQKLCHHNKQQNSLRMLWEYSEHLDWVVQISGMSLGPRLSQISPTYACSTRWGYLGSGGKAPIQSVKLTRLGFLAEFLSFDQICLERDAKFVSQISTNPQHVLHQLPPPVRNVPYSHRPRVHDRELSVASAAMRKTFVTRMLFLDTIELTYRLIADINLNMNSSSSKFGYMLFTFCVCPKEN